jgi:hypothetical protein
MPKPPSFNKPKCNSPAYSKFQHALHKPINKLNSKTYAVTDLMSFLRGAEDFFLEAC